MVCPSCGNHYEYGNNCPHCKVDTVLYAGVERLSNVLYNKGLACAKLSNLSAALEHLNKSVSINKSNTQARNLLGLIQYETGYVGDALKNWVISCGLKKEENPASTYIETFQKNSRTLERFNDSISLYNQALQDMWQNSEDMAGIKLKQALELNPKFIDALNLLTLCWIKKNDMNKAKDTIKRVLAIDINNSTALNYYNHIDPNAPSGVAALRTNNRKAFAATPVDKPIMPTYNKVNLHERGNKNFHLAGILSFVVGAICTVGVMYILVFPALDRVRANQIEEAHTQLTLASHAHDSLMEEKEQEISTLLERIDTYSATVQNLEDQYSNLERTFQILNAFELFRDNRLREAVDALGAIEVDDLAPDIVERANEIRVVAYPQLGQQYYNEGVSMYNAWNFETAKVLFERAYRYFSQTGNTDMHGEVLYYLAWTFSQDIDIDRAIQYFERFLEEFPGHRRTVHARNRLSVIN
ncbi:MAG: tetratricopeptide repeat protein [Defluviitaleaceae bacterium]|nr:tetratricopeptide repeat protein [Defluviitaleaceae bacterium]